MVTMVTTFLRLSTRDTRDNNCFSIYGYHHSQGAPGAFEELHTLYRGKSVKPNFKTPQNATKPR
jgi:hypothetical protein